MYSLDKFISRLSSITNPKLSIISQYEKIEIKEYIRNCDKTIERLERYKKWEQENPTKLAALDQLIILIKIERDHAGSLENLTGELTDMKGDK